MVAAGHAAAGDIVSSQVVSLMEAASRMFHVAELKIALASAALMAPAAFLAVQTLGQHRRRQGSVAPSRPSPSAAEKPYVFVKEIKDAFTALHGITTDTAGNVYVADGGRVHKFDAAGKPVCKWGGPAKTISSSLLTALPRSARAAFTWATCAVKPCRKILCRRNAVSQAAPPRRLMPN